MRWTAAIRKGIQAAATINFNKEFSDCNCKAMLKTLNRTPQDGGDAAEEVEQYIKEVAAGSFDPEELAAFQAWGGAETLSMAAKALHRKVFVITKREEATHYTVFRPATKTMADGLMHTSEELNKTAADWMKELRAEGEGMSTSGGPAPIVLVYVTLDDQH